MSETAKSIEARLDEMKKLSHEQRIVIATQLQNKYIKMAGIIANVLESAEKQGYFLRSDETKESESGAKIENSMQEVTRTFTK